MTDHSRELIGWTAAIVSFLAYPPYIVEFIGQPTKKFWLTGWMWKVLRLKGGTKPHQVTWLIWALLQFVIFNSIRQQGISASAWIALIYLVGSTTTAIFAYIYGERSWEPLDIACGILGGLSLLTLLAVKDPFLALLLAIFTDAIVAVPIVKGVMKRPADEPKLGWTIFLIGAAINILAIKTWNFQDAGFTIYLLIVVGYINALIWFRPRKG